MITFALFTSLFFSAFFSAAETAFTSIEYLQIRIIKKKHSFLGALVNFLYSKRETLISTILIGNNTANVIFSVSATQYTLQILGNAFVAIMTGCVIFVMLIFGEITPKQLALKYNRFFVTHTSVVLVVLYFVLLPFSKLFSFFAYLLSLIPFKDNNNSVEGQIYHEHLIELLLQMNANKNIKASNTKRVRRALELSEKKIEGIMTHRKDVKSFSSKDTIESVFKFITKKYYRHFPIYAQENKEEIIGCIHIKDILYETKQINNKTTLKKFLEKNKQSTSPLKLQESLSIAKVLPLFQEKKQSFAIVIDEFGGLSGVLTLTDIARHILMPELFIEDSTNTKSTQNKKQKYISEYIKPSKQKQTFLINPETPLSEIEDIKSVKISPKPESHTIGGYLVEYTGGDFLNDNSKTKKIEHPLLGLFTVREKDKARIISLQWNTNTKKENK